MIEDIYKEIKNIKEYAKENKVPIMLDDGIDFLTTHIIKKQVKTILEIGTAIGYSSIVMALSSPNVKIVTIEKDKDRYMEAIKNVKKFNLEDRITLIFNDALDVKLKDKFDLIFIDAAKSKNIEYFNHFEKNLAPKGSIITDNMGFHGYVKKELKDIPNRNLRGIVRKIKNYIEFLNDNPRFKTNFYEIGDGLAVTERRS